MLESNLVDDRDSAAEKKRQQVEMLILGETFGGFQITEYPPHCETPEQRQQFDEAVALAAHDSSYGLEEYVNADSIKRIVTAYACRKFALSEVMPAANLLAEKLQAVTDAYNERNDGELGGLLEQMTGAAGPLKEALERLRFDKTDQRIDMPKLLFIADMARLYSDMTGKAAGKTADSDKGTGSPFARFSFEAAKLAGCASDTVPKWAEALKKLLPPVLAYLAVDDKQEAAYEEWAAEYEPDYEPEEEQLLHDPFDALIITDRD